ncbi:Spore coat protein CotF [Clostridium sp. USBA 49]|jgi:similar to spore coat protein|uniref:spore coat protein n=1 Tax=Clostridium TaxID=1485 RepID=UPI0009992D20|nr:MULTISPECIES: spore coat protein [Clostridium]SKA73241.1 Spore coat protein CotF [Clostridium sp. USBA 49]
MSWLNNFLGEENNSPLKDKELSLDMLNISKKDIEVLSKAITEILNPELRQLIKNQLNSCIDEYFKIADYAISKNWYNAYANPGQKIKEDMQEAQNILNNNQ